MNTDSVGLKFALAILLVGLAMAGFFALVMVLRRRFPGGIFGAMPALGGSGFLGQGRGRQSRIRIVETVQVDPKRRAILIRRDNTEHLLLVGGPSDIVIESGIDMPFEAAEPEDEYDYREPVQEDDYRPEPPRTSQRLHQRPEPVRPVERPQPPAYQEWENDDEDDVRAGGQYLRPLSTSGNLETGIRPVTLARGIRPSGAAMPPAVHDDPEEAAIARELEAARRRSQVPAPQAALQASRGANADFDDILAREMEERLEAAKRQARALSDQQRRPITPSRPQPQDQRSMQAGINRIFGDGNEG